MIVLDASAVLEFLLRTPRAKKVESFLYDQDQSLHAPGLIDIEVVHTLRRLCFEGTITRTRAQEAIEDFLDLDIERYTHQPFVKRIWKLRNSLSAYDASYVVLAEILQAPLVTADIKLSNSHGHKAKIITCE